MPNATHLLMQLTVRSLSFTDRRKQGRDVDKSWPNSIEDSKYVLILHASRLCSGAGEKIYAADTHIVHGS